MPFKAFAHLISISVSRLCIYLQSYYMYTICSRSELVPFVKMKFTSHLHISEKVIEQFTDTQTNKLFKRFRFCWSITSAYKLMTVPTCMPLYANRICLRMCVCVCVSVSQVLFDLLIVAFYCYLWYCAIGTHCILLLTIGLLTFAWYFQIDAISLYNMMIWGSIKGIQRQYKSLICDLWFRMVFEFELEDRNGIDLSCVSS